jgi:cytochrome b
MKDQAKAPRRWDPIVKLTHWGIVAAIIGNALVTEEGSGWHIWVGYGLAALLGLRLLWGLIGPVQARFSAFPPSPGRAIAHIGEIKNGGATQHHSHNPLGALMVYAIWATLLVVIGSGIAMSGPPPADPSAVSGEAGEGGGNEEEEGEEHAALGNLLIAPAYADEGGEGEKEGEEDCSKKCTKSRSTCSIC